MQKVQRKSSIMVLIAITVVLSMLCLIQNDVSAAAGGSSGSPVYNQQVMGRAGMGSSSVGSAGAATESYPMGDVTLGYSSAGGWSLGAASAITRSTKDGIPGYTQDDTFMLNGQELVYVEGTNNPRVYRTKRDTFVKVEFYNPESINSSYWVVRNPDGSEAVYGAEKNGSSYTPVSNGRALPVGGRADTHDGKPWGWYINQQWSLGDYDLTYWEYIYSSDGEMLVDKIGSGKADKSVPYSLTCIGYVNMPECERLDYSMGCKISKRMYPRHVYVYTGYVDSPDGNTLSYKGKNYCLDSAYQIESEDGPAGEWQVMEITPFGSNAYLSSSGELVGSSLNPTIYEYYDYGHRFSTVVTISGLTGHTKSLRSSSSDVIDINGDGLLDIILKEKNSSELKVWYNQGDRTFSADTITLGDTRELYDEAGFMDKDKDGYPDRYILESDELKFWRNDIKNGGGFTRDSSMDEDNWTEALAPLKGYPSVEAANGLIQVPLDMDGDGEPERVYSQLQSGGGWNYKLKVYEKDGSMTEYTGYPNMTLRTIQIQSMDWFDTYSDLMDINGDGLPDKLYQKNDGLKVRYNTGYGFGTEKTLTADSDPDSKSLVDVEYSSGVRMTNYDYMDINGDGLYDRIKKLQGGDLEVWFNTNGTGFKYFGIVNEPDKHPIRVSPDFGERTEKDYIDFDADGFPDRVEKTAGSDTIKIWRNLIKGEPAQGEYAGRLKKVISPQGGFTQYKYEPLNKILNSECKPNMWVVKEVLTNDGFGDLPPTTYEYYDAVYDSVEREFRGFGLVVEIKPDGTRILTHSITDNYYLAGLPEKIEVYNADMKLFNEVECFYGAMTTVPGNSDIRFPYLADKVEEKFDGSSTSESITTEYAYDSYGNTTKIAETENRKGHKRITQRWYNHDTTNWNVRQLRTEMLIGMDRDGNLEVQNGKRYAYYANGDLFCEESWLQMEGTANEPWSVYPDGTVNEPSGSDTRWVRPIFYYYDGCGNLWRTVDPDGSRTDCTYDIKYGKFLVKKENAEGHISWNYYDNHNLSMYSVMLISHNISRGQLTKVEQEQNGTWSMLYYDTFGRVEVELELGQTMHTPSRRYLYCDAHINSDGSLLYPGYTVIKEVADIDSCIQSQTFEYEDGLGRIIQVSKGHGSKYTTIFRSYSISGNKTVASETVPCFIDTPVYQSTRPVLPVTLTESWMDSNEGWKTVVTGTDGETVVSTQRGMKKSTTDHNGATITSYSDGFGLPYRVFNEQNYLILADYKHDTGTGNLTWIFNGGNEIKIDFNSLGQKVKITDPDTGITTFTYDEKGNLISQTDANLDTVTYEYDSINRLTKATYPGTGNYDEYTYDENWCGTGKLASGKVWRDGQWIEDVAYSYDPKGNMTLQSKMLLYKTGLEIANMHYRYDFKNRLYEEDYPGGETVRYSYDLYGYGVDTVRDITNSYDYVSGVSYLPSGSMKDISYGNGVNVNYEYYDNGEDGTADAYRSYMLKKIYTSGSNNSVDLQYTYDAAGNVTAITDHKNPHYSQSFDYDEYNQLITARSNMYYGQEVDYEYDHMWNMTEKEGQSYSYGEDVKIKPHAVKHDGTHTYLYDARGNLTQKMSYQSLQDGVIIIPEQLLKYAVYGTEHVIMNDRAEAIFPSGAYAPVASGGNVSVGRSSAVGDVVANTVWLRDYAEVYGGIQTDGVITKQNNTVVTGIEYENTSISYSTLPSSITTNSISFAGVPQVDTYINPGDSATLSPGKYWNYGVNSGGELNLESGTYYFNKLTMNSGTQLNLDETNGPVTIYVQQMLNMRALVNHSIPGIEGAANLLIGYLGNESVYLGGQYTEPFRGSVIAPNASLVPGQECKNFEGMYIGRNVNFHQDSKVTYVPFVGLAPDVTVYTYDWNNNLIEVQDNYETKMTALYGIDGQRIIKDEGGLVTYYFSSQYEVIYDANTNTVVDTCRYYYANGNRIAKRNGDGLFYFINDHLGSTTGMTDDTGSDVKKLKYAPYGSTAVDIGTAEEDYRFNGKELDETGLYYYGARYYDADLGRFISADSILPGDGMNPQGLNRYSYCFNNPLVYTDPSGHSPISLDFTQDYLEYPEIDVSLFTFNFASSDTSFEPDATTQDTRPDPKCESFLYGFGVDRAGSWSKAYYENNKVKLGLTIAETILTGDFKNYWPSIAEKAVTNIGFTDIPYLSAGVRYGVDAFKLYATYKKGYKGGLNKVNLLTGARKGILPQKWMKAPYGFKISPSALKYVSMARVGAVVAVSGFTGYVETQTMIKQGIKTWKEWDKVTGRETFANVTSTVESAGWAAVNIGICASFLFPQSSIPIWTFKIGAAVAISGRATTIGANYWGLVEQIQQERRKAHEAEVDMFRGMMSD